MKPTNRSTFDQQNNFLTNAREAAKAKGLENSMLWVEKSLTPGAPEKTVIVSGLSLPLRPKYLVTAPFKFQGKKRKNSNSGGVGRAGRRAKRHGKRH